MLTFLEQIRKTHQDIEELELLSAHILMTKPRVHRDKITLERRVASFITQIQVKSAELKGLYEDQDGLMKRELDGMADENQFPEFYSKLKNIKDYYRTLPNQVATPFRAANSAADLPEEDLDLSFTGEESNGKFLDLHELYFEYINIKGIEKISYLIFLDRFDRFKYIPSSSKSEAFESYLVKLVTYLRSWIRRAQPLFNLEELEDQITSQFNIDWAEGKCIGFEREASKSDSLFCLACTIELKLGNKHFTKETVFEGHKTGKKHIKGLSLLMEKGIVENKETIGKTASDVAELEYQKKKPLAGYEHLVNRLVFRLKDVREDTKSQVERKQALTEQERIDDTDDIAIEIAADESEEDDEKIYNPLKLPIGWDGKPIPFWLFKLHGLGIEYPCEICGGFIYMGRKAFEKHFQEYRHAHGMKSLGIPNSRYFQDITSIVDAYALAEKLKSSAKSTATTADIIEEFEDDQGNVFNKKTYEDLKRQGIL